MFALVISVIGIIGFLYVMAKVELVQQQNDNKIYNQNYRKEN
jgi:hypothetical protein